MIATSTAPSSIARRLALGTLTFTCRPTRAQLRAARAGRYTLQIKAGPSARRLWSETLTTAIQLTGRLPRAR